MCQAVLQGIKNGRRATKILMDDFFSIPLHLAKKKNFFDTPLVVLPYQGEGGIHILGGLMTSHQNETFHSLFLCYPGNFGEKKSFFPTPPQQYCLTRGRGENPHFGGLLTSDQNKTFHSLCLCYLKTSGEKKNFFFTAPLPLVGPPQWTGTFSAL